MYQKVAFPLKNVRRETRRGLLELCENVRRLHNLAVQNIQDSLDEGCKYPNYQDNYKALKNRPEYKRLQANVAQGILYNLDQEWQRYFNRKASQKAEDEAKYLPPTVSLDPMPLMFRVQPTAVPYLSVKVPCSREFARECPETADIRIPIPKDPDRSGLKYVKIIPKNAGRSFDVELSYVFVGRKPLDTNVSRKRPAKRIVA